MCTYLTRFYVSEAGSLAGSSLPQPGEIWEVSRQVQSPIDCWSEPFQPLYSTVAQQFITGASAPRYGMIVREPEPPIELEEPWQEEPWQIVSVMVLSEETQFASEVDVQIPGSLLGLSQDMLAETWNVQPMLACNLVRAIGKRLSREVYDLLMSVGDAHYQPTLPFSKADFAAVGLPLAHFSCNPSQIEAFHQQEIAWSDVLRVPLSVYYTYLKAIGLTETILHEAMEIEQAFIANPDLINHLRINCGT